jgi:hypothetical protein
MENYFGSPIEDGSLNGCRIPKIATYVFDRVEANQVPVGRLGIRS